MMKKIAIGFIIIVMSMPQFLLAQKKEKKTKNFKVVRIINAPIDKVWKVVGEDYGAIANSHPKIVSSEYINGSLKAGEGAERVCNFNEKGTKFLRETQVDYDPENYSFKNQIFQVSKFPVVPEYSFATYKLEPIDDDSCQFTFDMTFRAKPAFMGGMMIGPFKKLIADYAIAVEHHVNTGENVTKDNFKRIKKEYKKRNRAKK